MDHTDPMALLLIATLAWWAWERVSTRERRDLRLARFEAARDAAELQSMFDHNNPAATAALTKEK